MIKKINYDEFEIYFKNNYNEKLGKKIVDKKYKVIEEYKNTERNYVAKIQIEDKKYVLKSPKSETIIPQRKIQTIVKKGEGLTSFYNIDRAKSLGINYFIEPLVVIVKRGFFLKESFILMDFIDGEIIQTKEDIDEIMKMIKKIHSYGIYHGDLNTSNFIKIKDEIKIIDSQAKREKSWNFKRAYDILTLKNDLLILMLKYDVEKNYKIKRGVGYLFAYIIKNFKKVWIIEKIRKFKVYLRNKGFKI